MAQGRVSDQEGYEIKWITVRGAGHVEFCSPLYGFWLLLSKMGG